MKLETPPQTSVKPQVRAAEKRELVSVHPSERKAVLRVNGALKKTVYQLKAGVPTIGIPGEDCVDLQLWLSGKADLKGL